MSDLAETSNKETASQQRAIENLATDTDTPAETVKEMYRIEHAKLERVARIKTYLTVLAGRRVKLILHNPSSDAGNDVRDTQS